MVSGVGRGVAVLDEMVIVEGEGTVLGINVGRHIITNGDSDILFPNYFEENSLVLNVNARKKLVLFIY